MAGGDGNLDLQPDVAAMARLAAWLDTRLPLLAVCGRTAFAVRLCLEEAVQNLVTHGGPAASTIRVSLERSGAGLAAEWDSNPRYAVNAHTLSKRAP